MSLPVEIGSLWEVTSFKDSPRLFATSRAWEDSTHKPEASAKLARGDRLTVLESFKWPDNSYRKGFTTYRVVTAAGASGYVTDTWFEHSQLRLTRIA